MELEPIRETAKRLLREYRRNHGAEANNPVMEALQARDDQETRAVYDAQLTSDDLNILTKWQIRG